MEKKITKGNKSNYEIKLTITKQEQEDSKKNILKKFSKDMDLPGFRKGNAPLKIVEENVKPEYITIGIFEDTINKGLKEIIDEQKDIKFIGEPYNIDKKEEKDNLILSFDLDIYPEVNIKNEKRKEEKIKEVKTSVSQKEIDDSYQNVIKNFADYKTTDKIDKETVSKINIIFLDEKGEEKDKKTIYIGEKEFNEDKFFENNFIGKKLNEEFKVKYEDGKMHEQLIYKKEDPKSIKEIKFIPLDIKKIVYPEINEKTIKKIFGSDTKIKNKQEFTNYIKNSIEEQKEDQELIKNVEEYINNIINNSMEIQIPQTIINEEFKTRMRNLEQRFGGKEAMEKYIGNLKEEEKKKFENDIITSAESSLKKFFILKQICDLYKLDINRDKPGKLEIEKKLYEKVGPQKSKK